MREFLPLQNDWNSNCIPDEHYLQTLLAVSVHPLPSLGITLMRRWIRFIDLQNNTTVLNCTIQIYLILAEFLRKPGMEETNSDCGCWSDEELGERNRAARCDLQSMEERPPTHHGPTWLASRHIWLCQNHSQSHQRYPGRALFFSSWIIFPSGYPSIWSGKIWPKFVNVPEHKRDPFRGSVTTRKVWHRWQSATVLLVREKIHPRCRGLATGAGTWVREPSFSMLISTNTYSSSEIINVCIYIRYWSKGRSDGTHWLSWANCTLRKTPRGKALFLMNQAFATVRLAKKLK